MHANARRSGRSPCRKRLSIARVVAFACAAILAAAVVAPAALLAQAASFKPPVQFEARIDGLGGPPSGAQLGVGANIAAGYYVRIGADIAGGAVARDGAAVPSGRVDITTRYLLDPFHEFRWGPYAGGGFTEQWDRHANWRGDLLLLIGVEGPVHSGWRTSFELGLGGGARLGVVLRRARSNGR